MFELPADGAHTVYRYDVTPDIVDFCRRWSHRFGSLNVDVNLPPARFEHAPSILLETPSPTLWPLDYLGSTKQIICLNVNLFRMSRRILQSAMRYNEDRQTKKKVDDPQVQKLQKPTIKGGKKLITSRKQQNPKIEQEWAILYNSIYTDLGFMYT